MRVEEFLDFVDSDTTIDSATGNGTSKAIYIGKRRYDGVPYSVQIHAGSSPVGAIQGVLVKDGDQTAFADGSTKWQDMTNGTISGNGLFHFYAPVTYLRIELASGTCKADVQY